MSGTPEKFNLEGPLPSGRLTIEASAGTGKTFTLSTLAARYVAEEGVAISDILVVTFTRAAAAELKDRVRKRLLDFAEVLGGERAPTKGVEEVVCSEDQTERLNRVRTAINEFDSATITTIHGFSQQVLGTLGSAIPSDPDAALVDDTDELVAQVATDLLVAEAVEKVHDADDVPDLSTLTRAASKALGNPGSAVVPSDDPAESSPAAALLRELCDKVAEGVQTRRRRGGTMSFDDLLVRLRDAAVSPQSSAAVGALLRERFKVVLIDEFQDTDPVQWDIFRSVFGSSSPSRGSNGGIGATLVLVGDPKQAIYGFRGANVHTYLQAAHSPGSELRSLGTNWRSDRFALQANKVLLEGSTFGDERISFAEVKPSDPDSELRPRTHSGEPVPAMSIRVADAPDLAPKKGSHLSVERAGRVCNDEMAVHVRHLLDTVQIPDEDEPDTMRDLRPSDCAVLVRTGRQVVAARDALRALGIPAVISRGEDVLLSEAATQWHHVLTAVARPADARRARTAALGWFFGWNATELANAEEQDLSNLQETLHDWGTHLGHSGVASFIGRVRAESGVEGRVLQMPDGDRSMTDLEHVAELLTLAAGSSRTPAALLSAFEQLSGGSSDGNPETDLAARRIESEGSSVQVMTTFYAKGLEFPVVCCPAMWWSNSKGPDMNVWWDEQAGSRTIDVASSLEWGNEEEMAERIELTRAEELGSDLRIAYVALTRAKHHTALWWAPTGASAATGLSRILLARGDDGAIDRDAFYAADFECEFGDDLHGRLAPLVEQSEGTLEVVSIDLPRGEAKWSGGQADDLGELDVATLDRDLSRNNTRWSFTGIARRSDHDVVPVDPFDDSAGDAGSADETATADEATGTIEDTSAVETDTAESEAGGAGDERSGDPDLPLGEIAGGAGFGTLVHEVLERVDFTDPALEQSLAELVTERLGWNPWPVDRTRLVAGLLAAIETPLGELFDDRPLRSLAIAERIDEFAFDLTLGEAGPAPSDRDIGEVILANTETGTAVHDWALQLADGPFSAVLEGHLTGSIDLVARVGDGEEPERFVVVDYKTNRLAGHHSNPTLGSFRPDRLAEPMAANHYMLQAILYSVGLHRYLRWRLPGYSPEVNLGGIAYLFVRGLIGTDTPRHDGIPHGVFQWKPPPSLIVELSDLLDGARAKARVSP